MIKNHLHLAAYDGHDEVVKTLLKQSSNKKNINAKDKNGWAPLHCAAARGHLKVSLICLCLSFCFLFFSLSFFFFFFFPFLPLFVCVCVQVCKLLINAGADVTAKNLDGATCLHYLARISNPDNPKQFVELLKLVLRKGAQVSNKQRKNTQNTKKHKKHKKRKKKKRKRKKKRKKISKIKTRKKEDRRKRFRLSHLFCFVFF